MTRAQLKPGDGVRVYGTLKGDIECNGRIATVKENMKEYGPPPGWLTVQMIIDGGIYTKHVHPKQLRRLRPRKQEAEAPPRLRELWVSEYEMRDLANRARSDGSQIYSTAAWTGSCGTDAIRFTETPPGHAVVSREMLWEAIRGNVLLLPSDFANICRVLKLPASGEGEGR